MFQVLMKDITTPVPPEEMKKLVKKCLEKAAHINYSQLMEYAQVKSKVTTPPPHPIPTTATTLI